MAPALARTITKRIGCVFVLAPSRSFRKHPLHFENPKHQRTLSGRLIMKKAVLLLLLTATIGWSQTVAISGKVSATGGSAIAGAIVSLVGANVFDTTDASGNYTLSGLVGDIVPAARTSGVNKISYENNSFVFTIVRPASIGVTLFDMRGARVAEILNRYLTPGHLRIPFAHCRLSNSMYIMRITSGDEVSTATLVSPAGKTTISFGQAVATVARKNAHVATTYDWLQAVKSGYSSYMSQLTVASGTVNITLSPAGSAAPNFGPNVLIFDPTMNTAAMQSQITAISNQQQGAQFGSGRYAWLFKPGSYSLDVNVGFYTEALGLGLTPDSVRINGLVESSASWMGNNATCTFWKACAGICVTPTGGTNTWAASQGAPVRRMHIMGNMALDDGGWSSGGYLGDCKVDGKVNSGSQQQYFSRNDDMGSWNGGSWNMVFVGVNGASPENGVNRTVVAKTPLSAEKPFLAIDKGGNYFVQVPNLHHDSTVGISWGSGTTPGVAVPIDLFYITDSLDNAASINAALSTGKNILFTPGHYNLESAIQVTRPGTIVLGIGYPTLTPTNGNVAMKIWDVDGVKLAGFLFEANAKNSPALLQVGDSGSTVDHSKNPIYLYDIFCRAGGAFNGLVTSFIIINSNDVIFDHTWLWRADHGAGAGWNSNLNAHGLIVNGNNVTVYGLFVEHTQAYQTWWNGNNGRTYFYQSEMPYDPPDNQSWSSSATDLGYPSYKVSDNVKVHQACGLGVYSVFHSGVTASTAIEVPANVPGIKFHHMVTEKLGGGTISHVINDAGGVASSSVLDFP
jgi:hypothetical protein